MHSNLFGRLIIAFGLIYSLVGYGKSELIQKDERLWPNYRHDGTLSAIFPACKDLGQAPVENWNADLGGPMKDLESVRFDVFNGDGHKELLRILPDKLICQSLAGENLWEVTGLKKPEIIDVRDYAGDKSRGLFISSQTDTKQSFFMINGRDGHKTLLYEAENVFGGSRRFGHMLSDVAGEQICIWWSGGKPSQDFVEGHGYLFSFENGLDNPNRRFEAHPKGVIYAPLNIITDMDLDGKPDMVMISHEQCWIWDLASGKQTSFTKWYPEIRSYQAWTGAIPLRAGEPPVLMFINKNMPGVQVVVQENGHFKRLWKKVVGPLENQYQSDVTIEKGAPDPYLDLNGDGTIEILAIVGNEHKDGIKHLIIFNSLDGERLFDEPSLQVLGCEDLDGDKTPEVFLKEGDDLRIAHWDGKTFKDLWRAKGVTPLYKPNPAEGDLTRGGGSVFTDANPHIWHEKEGSNNILLKFEDGVWSCALKPDGSLEKIKPVTEHEALATSAFEPGYAWNGSELKKVSEGRETVTYSIPRTRDYQAPPPVVGMLDDERQVIIRNGGGNLVSFSADGKRSRTLIQKNPGFSTAYYSEYPFVCDVDGDGTNEIVASSVDAGGGPGIVAVDGKGNIKLNIKPDEGMQEMVVAATGRQGPGKPNWLAIRTRSAYSPSSVSVYDGKSGERLWKRDSYGIYGTEPSKFVLHTPTSVFDYNGDGSDDMLCASENFFGIISIPDNKDITSSITQLSDVLPGHWTAYATPMVVNVLHQSQPQVFMSKSYCLALLMDLESHPIWHYGVTRDTTPRAHPGFPDVEGKGKRIVVTSRGDGLLTAFNSDPTDDKCPTCPTTNTVNKINHGASVRWKFQLPEPVSDITTADLDGDGHDEVLCGGGHMLFALKDAGDECQELWKLDLKDEVGSPVLADLNGDGGTEILVTTRDGRLHCLAPSK